MTIKKGEEWGERISVPHDFHIAEDDADLASYEPNEIIALRRGDMHRALGQPTIPGSTPECTSVHVDALLCRITMRDGSISERYAASSVSFGTWWSGEYVIVSNSGFFQGLNIAPRSHPNDGIVELFTISIAMSWRQRFLARRRARTGTHIPHPNLSIQRVQHHSTARTDRRQRLSLDGRAVADWERIDIEVAADHWNLLL